MYKSLKRWDITRYNNIELYTNSSVIVIIGRRDTGKTTLIHDILHHVGIIPAGTIVSHNASEYDSVVNSVCHSTYSASIMECVVRRQQYLFRMYSKENAIPFRRDVYRRAYVVLDNCIFDDSWTKDKLMKMMFMNGRLWNVMLIISMDYPLHILPMMSSQIDQIFIFGDPIKTYQNQLWVNYASNLLPAKFESQFYDIINQLACSNGVATETTHDCIVLDGTFMRNSNFNLKKVMFKYKAVNSRPTRPSSESAKSSLLCPLYLDPPSLDSLTLD